MACALFVAKENGVSRLCSFPCPFFISVSGSFIFFDKIFLFQGLINMEEAPIKHQLPHLARALMGAGWWLTGLSK